VIASAAVGAACVLAVGHGLAATRVAPRHVGFAPITRARDAALRKLLADAVARAAAPGGVLLVQTPGSTWQRALGVAQLAHSYTHPAGERRMPMRVSGRFRIDSVTKTFTAALVVQLAAAGKLSLNDTVEHWLPGRLADGAGALITVRDLLGHRSGLQDGGPVGPAPFVVAGPPGRFCYANANYGLLGEIVAAATHSTYEQELDARVIKPLGLTQTEVARGPATPRGLVHGYSPKPVTPRGLRLDETAWDDPNPAPAVSIVSDVRDVATFVRALFTGHVVGRDDVALMQTPKSLDGFDGRGYTAYGLGLMRFPTPCGYAWGHRGHGPGYMSYALSSVDGSRTAVLLLNDGILDDPVTIRLNPLVERALCT
jgi:D-alanyl-D-alanine carboxypeptidase